jgi:predicted ATPase with chaperone activity
VVQYLKEDLEITPVDYEPQSLFSQEQSHDEDFQDVKGQEYVKRALKVAAAGSHNLLMLGPPGSGKTMVARRMSTILPPLSFDEALECTKINSITGLIPSGTALISDVLSVSRITRFLKPDWWAEGAFRGWEKYLSHTTEFYFSMSFQNFCALLSNCSGNLWKTAE